MNALGASRRALMSLMLGGLGLLGCEDAPAGPDPRGPVIEQLATQVLWPSYEALDAQAASLEQAAQALCQAPDEDKLQRARRAWDATRSAYRQAAMPHVGLHASRRLDAYVDRVPTSSQSLEALIAGAEALTPELLQRQGANKRGLPALEYALYGDWPGQVSAQALTPATGEPVARRCALIVALAQDLRQQTQPLAQAWSPQGGAEHQAHLSAGQPGSSFKSRQALISEWLTQLLARVEQMTYTQIGQPSGLKSGQAPDGQLAQSWRAGRSTQDLLDELLSLRRMMFGVMQAKPSPAQALGLLKPTQAQSPELAARLVAAIEQVERALQALDGDLSVAVTAQPEQVKAVFEAMRALIRLIKTEWSADLGVVVTFNDNDGD